MISKVISGGQTGADRGALDWALERRIAHGGWCPKGRRAEGGSISEKYHLRETPREDEKERTEWNVKDSDGTVIFTISPKLHGGSEQTLLFTKLHRKPCVHLHSGIKRPASALRRFIREQNIRILNVAGSRDSEEPGIGATVQQVLTEAMEEGGR